MTSFGFSSTQNAPLGGGFLFSTPTTTTTSGASTLSGLLSGTRPTLSLGMGTATTTAVPATMSSGFSLGTTTVATTTQGTVSTSFGFGTGVPASSNIFGTTVATIASQGLGGVDHKTTSSSGATGKTCDSKALKENPVDAIILSSIEEFTKHVKNQKSIRENISRMSSKPLFKVEEDMKNLRQQLMFVSNGLHTNAAIIEKLKKQSTQDLKCAEMSQRTKDTPPGLQYENTSPIEYFQHLVEEFEIQMMIYRQQILETENHLVYLNQSSLLSPQEMAKLLLKLDEGFVALAAQLQIVHDAVKAQKEQYLEFRKAFHGDVLDIFEKHKKVEERMKKITPSTIGPTPFSTVPNINVIANTNQITAPGTGFGTGSVGLSQQPPGVSGSMFGTSFGSGGTTGLFGGTTSSPFAAAAAATAIPPLLNLSSTTGSTTGQLQKPFGSKRGKNA